MEELKLSDDVSVGVDGYRGVIVENMMFAIRIAPDDAPKLRDWLNENFPKEEESPTRKDILLAVENMRILCIRLSRATDEEKRAELVGHVNRIARGVGIVPSILREYTEEGCSCHRPTFLDGIPFATVKHLPDCPVHGVKK